MGSPFDFIGGAIKGAGEFAGGVLEHVGTGLTAVRDAERAKLALPGLQQKKIEAFLASQKIQDRLNSVRADAIKEGRSIYGGRGRSQQTDEERRAKLAEGYAWIGNVSSDTELTAAANAKARELLFGTGEKKETPDINPKALLSGNVNKKPQDTDRKGKSYFSWFGDDTISMDTANKAVKKTVVEWLFKKGKPVAQDLRDMYPDLVEKYEGAKEKAETPKAEVTRETFIKGLEDKGVAEGTEGAYAILERDDGSFYYRVTKNGIRSTNGPAGANTWTIEEARQKAIDNEFGPKPLGDIVIKSRQTGKEVDRIKVEDEKKKSVVTQTSHFCA